MEKRKKIMKFVHFSKCDTKLIKSVEKEYTHHKLFYTNSKNNSDYKSLNIYFIFPYEFYVFLKMILHTEIICKVQQIGTVRIAGKSMQTI